MIKNHQVFFSNTYGTSKKIVKFGTIALEYVFFGFK